MRSVQGLAMLRWAVFALPLCAPLSTIAQLDYLPVHERQPLSCGIPDSSSLVGMQQTIDSVTAVGVTNGRKEFLRDRAMVYYFRFLKWKVPADLAGSIADSEACWTEFASTSCLWDLGDKYRLAGDCTKALNATELYLTKVDADNVDFRQIHLRYKFCRGSE